MYIWFLGQYQKLVYRIIWLWQAMSCTMQCMHTEIIHCAFSNFIVINPFRSSRTYIRDCSSRRCWYCIHCFQVSWRGYCPCGLVQRLQIRLPSNLRGISHTRTEALIDRRVSMLYLRVNCKRFRSRCSEERATLWVAILHDLHCILRGLRVRVTMLFTSRLNNDMQLPTPRK